ncbi:uncharacterized protein SPPG_07605 [Spizellomyces punctatus DAOM BR117]|uniref:Piwi domain-containing protein n=1 Tax=Spizellomyces punctatus (strain DAOM BR117) TaxID=645134 RepID=A0A0L0H981_SPIPD|nr:uncharacterized protein SPPG_07605 [Spizellomyces punctatus DAOM BR117]KNC97218.1 hypothetical protein SPPG_07605 [Spizellomyces punctatus DAOM BR117]|eukprot:XP_016605258.1 hypothetical protein SPPG_07605 [Spizellomyces punctatus DAOM BR117]
MSSPSSNGSPDELNGTSPNVHQNGDTHSSSSSPTNGEGSLSDTSSEKGKTKKQTIVAFHPRPEPGTSGRPIRVRTNWIRITRLPTRPIIHYDVAFTPDVPPVFAKKVFAAFEHAYKDSGLGGMKPAFDGRKNMYVKDELECGAMGVFDIQKMTAIQDGRQLRAPRTIKMRVKKVATIDMSNLQDFLAGEMAVTPYDAIMTLDILLRQCCAPTHVSVGRSFYTNTGSHCLGFGAEVWPGYHQSIRPAGNEMKINLDVSSTAFYQSGPLLEIVSNILGLSDVGMLEKGLTERDKSRLEKTLKGVRVVTVHRGPDRKKFKIASLDSAVNTRFNINNVPTTVADYFHNQYNRPLRFPMLPVLIVGDPSKNMYLPMEVVSILPGQRHTRKLNERQTTEMIRQTCLAPYQRFNRISRGITEFGYADNEYLEEFGMKAGKDVCIVPARVLKTPKLIFGNNVMEVPKEGAWNWKGKKFKQPKQLESWAIVIFLRESECPDAVRFNFFKVMQSTCQEVGLSMPTFNVPCIYANPAGYVEGALKAAFLEAKDKYPNLRPQLIFCVLPNTGVPLYADIKRVSDTVLGIPTQCLQHRHVMDARKQYCLNVALKLNVKLGGTNLSMLKDELPFIKGAPTIIIGADVTHASPTEGRNKPSVISLVASMDANVTRYAASVRVKPTKDVYKEEMPGMIIELLKNFYQTTNTKPHRIIFYRDGVSEGQFGDTMTSEINCIRRACHVLERHYRPTITYVVVQKRHHTRFFPMDKNDTDKSGNCLPGTVVESEICHPHEFDFFLMSHPGLHGTSKPCHYFVLFDENHLTSDTIQEMTYKLAYIYARSTRAVSIVTPVYYANIVASRARYHSQESKWSDSESISDGGGAEYRPLKPELFKLMWYM